LKAVAIVIICLVLVIAGIYAVKMSNKSSDESTYLRIHIRANSNDAADQSVKYKVKESIVDFMTHRKHLKILYYLRKSIGK